MSKGKEFTTASASSLDAIGGENLIGSGFEEEIPDMDFARNQPAKEGGER